MNIQVAELNNTVDPLLHVLMPKKPKRQRTPARPTVSNKYDRPALRLLPKTLLHAPDERMATERITRSEAVRRCLKEYYDSIHANEGDRVVVAISAQDRDDIRRLVSNKIVPNEEFALTDAIHSYVPRVLKEREDRRKAL